MRNPIYRGGGPFFDNELVRLRGRGARVGGHGEVTGSEFVPRVVAEAVRVAGVQQSHCSHSLLWCCKLENGEVERSTVGGPAGCLFAPPQQPAPATTPCLAWCLDQPPPVTVLRHTSRQLPGPFIIDLFILRSPLWSYPLAVFCIASTPPANTVIIARGVFDGCQVGRPKDVDASDALPLT